MGEKGRGCGAGFGYQPALDGVRAVAVAAVLAFHLDASWMPGGYLGVSVFFTLSGFLITSLLLHEHAKTGRIAIAQFYVRRLRRLLPASLFCLASIAVFANSGLFGARAQLRAEVLGAVLNVANWRALIGGESYGDLFAAPSPVDHFWSLAIEEQFYLLWPIALAGVCALAARRGASVGRVLVGAFAVLALSAPATAQLWSTDAAYLASWTRFAEILAGAALAAVRFERPAPTRVLRLAGPCLLAVLAAFALTPAGHGWAYAGGLPLFALLSVGLIAGLQHGGAVTRALSWAPLVWLGRVSFGVYVFHWPLFAVLDTQRTGLAGWPLAAVRVGATLAVAAASYRWFERPIRTGHVLPRPPAYVRSAAAAFVAVLVAVVVAVPGAATRASDRTEAVTIVARQVPLSAPAASTESSGAPPVASPAQPATPVEPTTIAVFGDSVPDWLLRDGSVGFSRTDVVLIDAAHEGCDASVARPPWRDRDGNPQEIPDFCQSWPVSYGPVVASIQQPVDIAVLVLGPAVIIDRMIGDQWVGPCDDMAWYRDDISKRIRFLDAHVDRVVLALPSWGGRLVTWFVPDDHFGREACARDQLAATAAAIGVPTVDLAELLCPAGPAGECPPLRERDGMHVDPEDAPAVLDWLLNSVLAAAGRR